MREFEAFDRRGEMTEEQSESRMEVRCAVGRFVSEGFEAWEMRELRKN